MVDLRREGDVDKLIGQGMHEMSFAEPDRIPGGSILVDAHPQVVVADDGGGADGRIPDTQNRFGVPAPVGRELVHFRQEVMIDVRQAALAVDEGLRHEIRRVHFLADDFVANAAEFIHVVFPDGDTGGEPVTAVGKKQGFAFLEPPVDVEV